MEFEGLICPKCSSGLNESDLKVKLECPHCGTKFHDRKYIAFIEYLMMNGIIEDIDFFDRTLYGDEIKLKSETEEDLMDETNPDEYDGGELQIEDPLGAVMSAPRTKGTLIFFDSRTRHRVSKVSRGLRKSLVGWVLGPKFK